MSVDTILYEKHDGCGWITLNRPEVLNAYNVRMRDELYQALGAVRADSDVRVLVIRGAGRAFCAGADLTEFGTAPSPTTARRIRFLRDVWTLLYGLDIPTIAAVHGFVFGSGLEIALFCDIRIAQHGAVFGMPEIQLGFIPAAGGTQTLARTCGQAAALDLLLTGRQIDAREALRLGLVTRIVEPDAFDSAIRDEARRLADLDPAVVRAIRRAVREGIELPLAHGRRLEADLAFALRSRARRGSSTG